MEGNSASSLTERQQYWLTHVRACDSAGKTTVEYARVHGLNAKSMYSARKALVEKGTLPRAQPQANSFQKVQVSSSHLHTDNQWRIELPNGAVIVCGEPVDATTLSLVLNTAASLS